ncbi:MAG: hemerythrin domain-containing protein [Desulfomonilaceae bacterium]
MKATEQLRNEHEGIKIMMHILEKLSGKLEEGEDVDPEHLEKIIEFFRVFADKCHHGKEEDLLFPAMEAVAIPREGGPIGVMLLEHDKGRGYIQGMAEAVSKYRRGDRKAAPVIASNARNYIALLTQHIEKENAVLFPMADSHLSEEKQASMFEEFEKIEEEKIGVGKHEEFHQLLDNLSAVYLK